jgi:hypothetical protein
MQQKQETCFHEGESWARQDVLAETAEALWFSDGQVEEDFNLDDLEDFFP